MKLCHKFLILFIPFYLLFSVLDLWAGPSQEEEKAIPKNIILFIGDGMGIGQITAAKIDKGELNLERFKTVGLLSVFPADFFLPSSEASTTAIATGFKTNKAYIGVSTSGEPLNTVLEYAEERGKSTGLVVTSSLVETTPACFASHELSRHEKRAIAESLVDSGVDVMFGGGLLDFSSVKASHEKEKRDLIIELKKRYPLVTTKQAFRELGTPKGAYGFFAMDYLPLAAERDISLTEMTEKAIEILSTNENGFFLMVEGSRIDWAAHQCDVEAMIAETEDFDEAVGAGYKFAEGDGNTLVIVTADHETGGYNVMGGKSKAYKSIFASVEHSANMVPLFAYGPGSEAFGGIHPDANVGKILVEYVKTSGHQDNSKENNSSKD